MLFSYIELILYLNPITQYWYKIRIYLGNSYLYIVLIIAFKVIKTENNCNVRNQYTLKLIGNFKFPSAFCILFLKCKTMDFL